MEVQERIKQIEDKSHTDEYTLHQLLELAMNVTGRGYVSDDYTHFIEIGDVNVFSDPYYENVQIDEQDLNQENIKIIIKEMKVRLLQFEKKTQNIRDRAASEIFNRPIKELEVKQC